MNYKIIGADGKTYGPVTAEQIHAWMADGRVEKRTPVFVDGAADWTFVGLLPEFGGKISETPPVIGALNPGNRRTNGFAVAGFTLGIFSLICCCGCPFNILGLIFSLVALQQINAQPLQEGRGLAIAGLVCSAISLLLALGLGVIEMLAAPAHMIIHNNFQ